MLNAFNKKNSWVDGDDGDTSAATGPSRKEDVTYIKVKLSIKL